MMSFPSDLPPAGPSDHDLELLSALVDGEAVDPDALEQTLDTGAGRAALVDFARLRHALAADDDEPSERFAERTRRRLGRPVLTLLRRPLAALLAVAAAVALWWALTGPPTDPDPAGGALETAPAPTRVLRFEEGVDWPRGA